MAQERNDLMQASDDYAVAIAKAQKMTRSEMSKAWGLRWESSGALQAEFESPETYSNYMQGLYDGRIHILGRQTQTVTR